jgi:hypothetical protein
VSQDAVPDLHWNSTEVAPQRVRDTGFGRNGCALELTRKLCVLCAAVFIYPGENRITFVTAQINPLNAKLNPICHLLALLGAHHILHVSRVRVNCAAATVTDNRMKRNSVACFLASAAMQMTSAHFRDFTQRRMAVSLPTVCDKTFGHRLQGSSMARRISS